ncbi:uncharacterized protein O3C94_022139 [Discoglossus pictus]
MSDPRSRKQRLMMAAQEEGEGEAPAGEAHIYCFICGGGVPPGREVRLPVRCPAQEGSAFFPFLQQQEPAPGADPLSPAGCARVCGVCGRFLGAQWDSFERSRTPLDKRMYWLKRPYQCGEGGRAHPPSWNPTYDSDMSDLSESDPEEERPARSRTPDSDTENGHIPAVCYICGGHGAGHVIHVQKQEHSPETPFFPFLWLHTPPPGAQPITPGGSARACARCFSSLMQQWHSFDLANVPVLQRLYVVPLQGSSNTPEKGPPQRAVEPKSQGVCYLCGEDCTNHARLVRSNIANGNAKSTMHFPFITQMPCPPNSRGVNQQGEVQSCRKCYGVLEDIWAIYRASNNEDLINSVQSFLGRYHQVFFTLTDPAVAQNRRIGANNSHSTPTSICYVCGAELGPGSEYQLSINPPNRYGDKEPFFPFLTVYPSAPRARPVDSTGMVTTCGLCYHDLLGQWFQQEMKATQHSSSPWSRQYQVESFVCFFCRLEKKRVLGLKAIQVARLPVFLLAPRVPKSLFVDDGKKLLIGTCIDCRPLALVGMNATHCDSSVPSPAITHQVALPSRDSVHVSSAPGPCVSASLVAESEKNSKTVKDPPLAHCQESSVDVERVDPVTAKTAESGRWLPPERLQKADDGYHLRDCRKRTVATTWETAESGRWLPSGRLQKADGGYHLGDCRKRTVATTWETAESGRWLPSGRLQKADGGYHLRDCRKRTTAESGRWLPPERLQKADGGYHLRDCRKRTVATTWETAESGRWLPPERLQKADGGYHLRDCRKRTVATTWETAESGRWLPPERLQKADGGYHLRDCRKRTVATTWETAESGRWLPPERLQKADGGYHLRDCRKRTVATT